MSEQAATGPRFPVSIQALDRGTQIVVVGATFEKLGSGVGALRLALPRGLYKARFKVGDRIADTLFEVGDQPVNMVGPALSFSSPIPMVDVSNTHEYQHHPAGAMLAGSRVASIGSGAELFVFGRDSRQALGKRFAAEANLPWQGLALRGLDGRVAWDIAKDGIVDPGCGTAGLKLAADPGVYLLTLPDCQRPDLRLELPIVLCRDFSTQVYIDSIDAPAPSGASARKLDLSGSAIVMARTAAHLDDETLKLTEVARQGFMHGQAAVSEADLRAMVEGKLESPMLGLYAAHLLLARPDADLQQIAQIGQHLDRFLGSGHPDVDVLLRVCLRRGVAVSLSQRPALWPPMLSASYRLALTLQADRPLDPRPASAGQYHVGGSMWNCSLRPTGPAGQDGSELGAGLAPDPGLLGEDGADSEGGDGIHAEDDADSEDGADAERGLSESEGFSQVDPLSMQSWRALLQGLRRINPRYTPFQQAVRRRVLDLLEDDAEALDLTDLARQFHLPIDAARAALEQLRRDAETIPQRKREAEAIPPDEAPW